MLAKLVLLVLLLVVVDPTWGNLEGKAPTARALTYPMLAIAVPVWWRLRRPDSPNPWLPDLLLTAALAWEVFEYVTFVTQSAERPTAYPDTIGDLVLGWVGTILAAGLVHSVWRHHLPVVDDGTTTPIRTPDRAVAG